MKPMGDMTDEEIKALVEDPDYCERCEEIDCQQCHCCQCNED